MDRVTFGDGISYEKASVLAKRYNYTADYVGQLCRAHKVDARLVGRTWYVNPESLEKHQSKKNRQNEIVLNSNSIINKSRIDVPPVVGKNTSRSLRFTSHQMVAAVPSANYNADEHDLYPRVSRQSSTISTSVPVKLSDATGIRVHTTKKVTYFKASSLPEVTLSGSLTVTDALDNPPKEESASAVEPLEPSLALDKTQSSSLKPSKIITALRAPIHPKTTTSAPHTHVPGKVAEKARPALLLAAPRPLLLVAAVVTLILVGFTSLTSSEYYVSTAGTWSSLTFDTTQLTAFLSFVSYTH